MNQNLESTDIDDEINKKKKKRNLNNFKRVTEKL